MPELTRRRRLLMLAICCMSLLIVGMDNTIVNVALPSIRARPARLGLGPAVDDRRLHPGAGQPADPVRLDRRPARPAPDVPDRPGAVHRSARCCAAWRRAWAG